MSTATEQATLGGGCFWCLEAVFEKIEGVERVVSGYTGGQAPNPNYRQVCSGGTGHAEVVQVTFDPAKISFKEILELFFAFHDPTTRDRQGGDIGTQYRSAIFYHSPEQKRIAQDVIKQLTDDGIFKDMIVTEVVPLPDFYPAEDYHQGYYSQNPAQPYCQAVISPKVSKLRKHYANRMKSERPV
ncbi:peptide-methionine (S)-S-oxide reductase MsrA [soil metagenome]